MQHESNPQPYTDNAGNLYSAVVRKLPAEAYPGMHCDGCAFAPVSGGSRTPESIMNCAVADCYLELPGHTVVFVKNEVSTGAGRMFNVPPEDVTAAQRAQYKVVTFYQRWRKK